MNFSEAPSIASSTRDEREQFVKDRYPCISDCDSCGICAIFHGKDAMLAYRDYIDGKREFLEISREYRR